MNNQKGRPANTGRPISLARERDSPYFVALIAGGGFSVYDGL
jgi:hypothetical protein